MGLFKKKLKKEEASPMKVNKYIRGAVRQFSFWFAHGTIGVDLLNGIDYTSSLREESSFAEQAYIIFMNMNLQKAYEKGNKLFMEGN